MNERDQHSDFKYDNDSRLTHAGLKQRLVGAVVLVSLAVIFLPMIFDQPHEDKKNTIIAAPDLPPEKTILIEQPKRPVLDLDQSQQKHLDTLAERMDGSINEPGKAIAESVITVLEKEKKRLQARQGRKATTSEQAPPIASYKVPDVTITPDVTAKSSKSQPVTKVDAAKARHANKADFAGKWMVQLGSFGTKTNAVNLANKVRQRGFMTHTLGFKKQGKVLTKVLVGPFDTKTDANRAKKTLDLYLKLKSIVLKF
ncbi:MAG: hypothetical protein CSA50_01130 [Gammaproteobacteria bacterium]|nr:MAG: hypothetical protein CSA50_01130 [Gammaproteobacteria bacterium]